MTGGNVETRDVMSWSIEPGEGWEHRIELEKTPHGWRWRVLSRRNGLLNPSRGADAWHWHLTKRSAVAAAIRATQR